MLHTRRHSRAALGTIRRITMASAFTLAAALGAVGGVRAQASPPRATLITVADNVRLEVLDWGGKNGYESTTLVRDLVAVLDSLRLAKASFAGHSFAGSEMSILAARFPERVDRLIYLDSGFDYRQLLDRIGVATALGSPQPQPGAYDRGTVADWTLDAERSSGAGFPESEVRAMFRVGADAIVQGSATAPETTRAMLDGIEPAPPTKIRAPTLAIYAAPTSAEVMYPSWYAFDDTTRQRGRTVYAAVSAEHEVQRARFKREVARSRQVIIAGARHYLFLTHPGEVAHEILSFMLSN